MNQAGLLKNKTALVVEPKPKNQNDRTWGFWSKQAQVPFQDVSHRQWSSIEFYSQFFNQTIDIHPYNYYLIRGIDFYEFVLKELKQNENICFLKDSVIGAENTNNGIGITTTKSTFTGDYLFDSRFEHSQTNPKAINLKQHFKGYIVETKEAHFNPQQIKLFDFRTPQKGLMRFFYVLPFSKNKALVEYTLFSEDYLESDAYDIAIKNYLKDILKITNYQVLEEEFGMIPMSNQKVKPINGNILKIGTAGGRTKASSGYTFTRIQKHTQAIVSALQQNKSPLLALNSGKRFELYDTMLLKVLKDRGDQAEKVFSDLFQNNPTSRLFSFLDEETSVVEDIQVMASVPSGLFLKAGINLLRGRSQK